MNAAKLDEIEALLTQCYRDLNLVVKFNSNAKSATDAHTTACNCAFAKQAVGNLEITIRRIREQMDWSEAPPLQVTQEEENH